MRKSMKVLAAASLLSISCVFAAYAGWEQDEKGYYYQNESGSYARDQILNIDGVNYGFNGEAYMMTGWNQMGGNWYYFDPASGAQLQGWQQINGSWYYLNPGDGVMKTSWFKQGANLYYLDPNGAMKTGYFDVDGLAYHANESGVIYRNTSTEDGNGNIFVYDDLGRIKIANKSTRNISKGEDGGSAFQDFLSLEFFGERKEELIAQAEEVVNKKMDELYVKYKKKMVDANTTRKINSRTEDWEKSATRALTELQVSQEEIDAYLYEVEHNQYQSYGDLSDYGYDEIDENYEYDEDDDEDDDFYDYDDED